MNEGGDQVVKDSVHTLPMTDHVEITEEVYSRDSISRGSKSPSPEHKNIDSTFSQRSSNGELASRSGSSSGSMIDVDSSTNENAVPRQALASEIPSSQNTSIENAANESIRTEDGDYEYSDDFEEDSGEESDIEDNADTFPSLRVQRVSNPTLPDTVTTLETEDGCKVYLVGTAHFSVESQMDVTQVITSTQPDVVMVELCNSRVNILQLDEKTLLEEASNINMDKIRTAIKQSGLVQGIMHLLLLSMSAHLTKQLGMAPGGEFRKAFNEAQKVPGCRIQLGDRPIQITLRRALGSLSLWQKVRLAWYMITNKEPISKEEVEKCKQKDLLEQMLKEMTGEFPALSAVFVQERDIFLANSLRIAAQPIQHPDSPSGFIPSVVVGVVGIGHVPGIKANWGKKHNIREIMSIPEASAFSHVLRWGFRASLVLMLSYGCYRFIRFTAGSIL